MNDFAPLLGFPTSLMRSRRDHDRFLDLIACVCFLRQYQKQAEKAGHLEFIRCDLEDYRVAYRIMVEGVMSSTVRELPTGAVGSVRASCATWVEREAKRQKLKAEEVSFTQRQVREITGLGHTWVKQSLRQLVDYDYLSDRAAAVERSTGLLPAPRGRGDHGDRPFDDPDPEAMAELLAAKRTINLVKLAQTGH